MKLAFINSITLVLLWSSVSFSETKDLENQFNFTEVLESEFYDEQTERPSQKEVDDAKKAIDKLFPDRFKVLVNRDRVSILDKYSYIDPGKIVPQDLLEDALIYFDSNSGFTNRNFITIVDYSLPSWKKRLFIIRMSDGEVYSRHVGHGKNSDPDHNGYLDYYSNVPGSYKSSKGFYRAAEIYWSSNQNIGRALKLDGLSSTNSNARSRGIVFHGSSYVKDQNVKQGRSLGCVTISWNNKDEILDILTGGSLLYVNNSDF